MASLDSTERAKVALAAGESLIVTTTGQCTVQGLSGAPATTTTLTANTQTFGPYGVSAVLLVTNVSGRTEYSANNATFELNRTEKAAFDSLVSGAGDWQTNNTLQKWTPLASKLEDFSNFSEWSVGNVATATVTDGASVRNANWPYAGGLRFQSTGGATESCSAFKTLSVNGTADGICLSTLPGFWIVTDVQNPFPNGAASIGLNVAFFEGTGGWGNGWQLTVVGPSLSCGVQARWIPRSILAVAGSPGPWTTPLKSLRIRHDGNSGTARDVSLVGMFTRSGRRPTVMFSFDDGWDTSFSIGHASARKRGIPLTHFLIPDNFGSANYITAAQASQMRAAGDYLGLHGGVVWDTDVSRLVADIAKCKAAGIDIQHAAIVGGQYGDLAQRTAMRAAFVAGGVKTARLSGTTGSPHLAVMLHGVGDPYSLLSYGPNNTDGSALANAKLAIDYAIQAGGAVCFYLHRIGATSDSLYWNQGDYEQLLDYAWQKRLQGELDITTVDRWYDAAASGETRNHLDVRQGVRIPVTASRSLTLADDGATLQCSAAVTLTVPQDLNLFRGVTVQCPASGTVTVAVGGTVTINGAATSLTRTRAANFAGFSIIPADSPNVYGVSGA